jgi:hypothetical protein
MNLNRSGVEQKYQNRVVSASSTHAQKTLSDTRKGKERKKKNTEKKREKKEMKMKMKKKQKKNLVVWFTQHCKADG